MKDPEFEKTLQGWRPRFPAETGFQRAVWNRIEAGRGSPGGKELVAAILASLTRPLVGVPAALALVAVTVALAVHNGTRSRDSMWTELSLNYRKAIDPVSHVK